jgi:hypothetical protein
MAASCKGKGPVQRAVACEFHRKDKGMGKKKKPKPKY